MEARLLMQRSQFTESIQVCRTYKLYSDTLLLRQVPSSSISLLNYLPYYKVIANSIRIITWTKIKISITFIGNENIVFTN